MLRTFTISFNIPGWWFNDVNGVNAYLTTLELSEKFFSYDSDTQPNLRTTALIFRIRLKSQKP